MSELAPLPTAENTEAAPFAGRFRLLELLGQGGTSAVYKALDMQLDRVVAIKLLHPELVPDSTAFERFRLEALAASRLSHPNIAKVFAFGATNEERSYLAMELIDGVPLARLLAERGQLEPDCFRSIFTPLLNALSYAHASGIVHRDIKPGNILISFRQDGTAVPCLIDFGLAKLLTADNGTVNTRTVAGSPLYMSPEQCIAAAVDERSDIYSIACVMYECLAGRPPFAGGTAFKTMYEHLKSTVPDFNEVTGPVTVPRSVALTILKALSKERQMRQQSMDQLAAELNLAFDSAPVANTPSKRLSRVVCAFLILAAISTVFFMITKNHLSAPVSSSANSIRSSSLTGPVAMYSRVKQLYQNASRENNPNRCQELQQALVQINEVVRQATREPVVPTNLANALLLKGHILNSLGKQEQAVAVFGEARDVFPYAGETGESVRLEAVFCATSTLRTMGKPNEALKLMNEGIADYERSKNFSPEKLAIAYWRKGQCFTDAEEAIKAFSKSVELHRASPSGSFSVDYELAVTSLMEVKHWSGKGEQAVAMLKSLESELDNQDDFYKWDRYEILARSAKNIGRVADACRLYEKALALLRREGVPLRYKVEEINLEQELAQTRTLLPKIAPPPTL